MTRATFRTVWSASLASENTVFGKGTSQSYHTILLDGAAQRPAFDLGIGQFLPHVEPLEPQNLLNSLLNTSLKINEIF